MGTGMSDLSRHLLVLAFACVATFAGCAPTSSVCNTADGSSVDTYQIFGKWKKISGYTVPRTTDELKLNFDLLVIKKGKVMCSERVVSGASDGFNYFANYVQDVPNKKLDLSVVTADSTSHLITTLNPDTTITGAQYSFTGSCSSTQLKLRLPGQGTNGGVLTETYELYNTSYDDTDCAIN